MQRKNLSELNILIIGAGEAGSAVAHRLRKCNFKVVMTEIPQPLAISRGTCYSEAVYDGEKTVENITAKLCSCNPSEILKIMEEGKIPLIVDPSVSIKQKMLFEIMIDARMAKNGTILSINDAQLTIGLGPRIEAGKQVHAVIETNNSNNLGRVITEGEAENNTSIPVSIGGYTIERVIWAEKDGVFETKKNIAEKVNKGKTIGLINNQEIKAPMDGIIRGLLRPGTSVKKGTKLVEIDPVSAPCVCYSIRDKMRAISGGVIEAILMNFNI